MTIWCIARLKPAKRRIIRERPEYREVKSKGRIRYVPKPRTGTAVFGQKTLLERMGFQVYMPARYEWRIVNRFTKEKEKTPVQRLQGWAFIGESNVPRWDILKNSGVVSFFGAIDGTPVTLTDEQMLRIMHQFGDVTKPEVERYMQSHAEFSAGDTVKMSGDLFGGIEFIVKEVSGDMTRICAEILGADRDIEVPTWELRKCG